MLLMMIPILVVLTARFIAHGVVVHRLQQPVPVVLLHVTYNASNDDSNDSNDDDDDNDDENSILPHCDTDVAPGDCVVLPDVHWVQVLPLM